MVDNRVVESILASYSRGLEERRARELQEKEQERYLAEQENRRRLEEQRIQEATRAYDLEKARLDQAKIANDASIKQAEASLALQRIGLLPGLTQLAESTGQAPGFSKAPAQRIFTEDQEGAFQEQPTELFNFTGTLPGLEGLNFSARSPEKAAQDEARLFEIANRPKEEAAQRKAILDATLEQEIDDANRQAQADAARIKRESDEQMHRETLASRREIARITGNNAKETTVAAGIADDYRNDQVVKNFIIVKEGYDYIKGNTRGNAISDYSLLVAYIKVIDPGSVAREGEVQALKNGAQTYSDKFKYAVSSVTTLAPFLSATARAQMLKEMEEKYAGHYNAFNRVKDEKQKLLSRLNIDSQGWIIDYSGDDDDVVPFDSLPSASPSVPSNNSRGIVPPQQMVN